MLQRNDEFMLLFSLNQWKIKAMLMCQAAILAQVARKTGSGKGWVMSCWVCQSTNCVTVGNVEFYWIF